jgi:phenylalanyl-tRNA synthetase beta chain
VDAELVCRTIRLVDRVLITDVRVFDVYAGKGIEPGYKSLGIAVTLQPRDATLTDAQIDEISKRIVDAITQKTGGVLRG